MATKQQVLDLHHAHPDWSYQQIAAEIGALDAYVYKTFVRLRMEVPKKRPDPDPATLRARAAVLIARAEQIEAKQSR